MQIQYFQTAWDDIKNSEGWFGKLCLLALVGLIPIFGQIVTLGYLFGWAREIAWGVHEPMPAKIFGNEDGKLYRRGWFIFLVTFVFGLIPSIVTSIGSMLQGTGMYAVINAGTSVSVGAQSTAGGLLYLVGIVLAFFMELLAWVASMRVAIYDTLSSGFQFGAIWKMFRHDTNGILRIFGMSLIVSLIVGFVLSIVFMVLVFAIVMAGIGGLVSSGYSLDSLNYFSDIEAMRITLRVVGSAGLVGMLCLLVMVFVASLSSVFVDMLVARALGYWTWKFDVPNWRSQNDPLPFEQAQSMGVAAQTYQPPVNASQPAGTPVAWQPTQAPTPEPGIATQQGAQQPVDVPSWSSAAASEEDAWPVDAPATAAPVEAPVTAESAEAAPLIQPASPEPLAQSLETEAGAMAPGQGASQVVAPIADAAGVETAMPLQAASEQRDAFAQVADTYVEDVQAAGQEAADARDSAAQN